MKNLLAILIVLICAGQAIAQDKIYKKDKSVIECKIVEIGLDEIKYVDHLLEDSPIISIAIDDLSKIELSSGRVIEFKDRLTDPNSYADDRKVALKFHFLSPLMEHIGFSYERSIKPGSSFESEIGIIGIGFNTNREVRSNGIYISAGYKFLKTPDFYSKRFKYSHILKGAYVKPQLIFTAYELNNERYDPFGNAYDNKENVVAGAFIMNLGSQTVYNNLFLIDYSVGVGYGFSSQSNSSDDYNSYRANHYAFLLGSSDVPLAITGKIKLGILIK
ncbi:hypothetical protein [Fulvivirga sp.]|jgi:hypothetical protein|uniref:hypothetical protein n=1 Tax=Fulvivirga sp. TaxID=1931237 RepID=UPI0032EB6A3C